MTDRERFEAWSDECGLNCTQWHDHGHWAAWQASRRQALAEAIAICESGEEVCSEDPWLGFCLHGLRCLANPEGEQG